MSFPLFSIVQRLGSNQEKGERAWREIQPATPLCVLYGKNFTLTWPSAKLSGRNGSLLFEAFSRFCDFLLSLPLFHFSHLASILSFSLYLFPPSSIDRSMPDWMFHSKSVKSKLLLLLLFRFLSFFLSLPFPPKIWSLLLFSFGGRIGEEQSSRNSSSISFLDLVL